MRGGGIWSALLGGLALPLLSFATGPILAYALGPDGRGVLAAATSTMAIVPLIANGGMVMAVQQFTASGMLRARQLAKVYLIMPLLGLAGGAAVALIAFVAPPEYRWSFFAVAIATPVILVLDAMRAVVSGRGEFRYLMLESWVIAIVRAVALAVLALAGLLTPETALLSTVIPSLIAAGVWFRRLFSRRDPLVVVDEESATTRGPFVRFAALTWAGQVAAMSNGQLDQAVMAFLTTSEQIGYYVVAVSWLAIPSVLVGSASRVILVRAGSVWTASHSAAVVRVSLLVGSAAAVVTALASPFAIPILFGTDFAPAISAVWWLLPGMIGLYASRLYGALLLGYHKPIAETIANVAALAATVGGLLALTPWLGADGAAITSSVAYLIAAAVCFGWVRRLDLGGLILPQRGDFSLAKRVVLRQFGRRRGKGRGTE